VTEGSRSVENFKGMFHCFYRKSRYSVLKPVKNQY